MTRNAASTSLADALDGWAPDAVHSARRVDPWPAAAFAALLDTAPPPLGPGDPLPPLWHWFTLLDHPTHAELGADGHPADGHFLPPIPHRRRMFAGGRYHRHGPIPVGADLTCRSSLAGVTVKHGRSGELAFVTVRHELSVGGTAVGVEEQDIVYRSQPEGVRTMFNYATNQVHYHGLRVPADHVIGEVDQGFRYVIDGWNAERILLASEAIGDGYWSSTAPSATPRTARCSASRSAPIRAFQVAPVSNNLIKAFVATKVLGLPRSY